MLILLQALSFSCYVASPEQAGSCRSSPEQAGFGKSVRPSFIQSFISACLVFPQTALISFGIYPNNGLLSVTWAPRLHSDNKKAFCNSSGRMNNFSRALFHWFLLTTEIRDEEDTSGCLTIFQSQRDKQMFLGHIYQFFI